MEQITDIQQFCRHHKISLADFGSRLSPPVDKSTVSRWVSRQVPAERVRHVSELTGIPFHLLRPDVFPGPEGSSVQSTPSVAAVGEGDGAHG